MNILLLAAFTMAGFCTFAQNDKIIKDNNAQKRDVKDFHAIRIGGGIDLYLSQGDEVGVAVSASDLSFRDRIRTEVENGVLNIYLNTEGFHWGGWGDKHLKAYVSVKQLDGLKASGGSDVFIQDVLKSGKLDITLSGGSDLKGKIAAQDLSIMQSGGSDSFISGSAGQLSVHASGGSDFHGYDLVSEACEIEASGGSDIRITVNKELNVSASGGSDVYYKGSAAVRTLHSSGSSDVVKKG